MKSYYNIISEDNISIHNYNDSMISDNLKNIHENRNRNFMKQDANSCIYDVFYFLFAYKIVPYINKIKYEYSNNEILNANYNITYDIFKNE